MAKRTIFTTENVQLKLLGSAVLFLTMSAVMILYSQANIHSDDSGMVKFSAIKERLNYI